MSNFDTPTLSSYIKSDSYGDDTPTTLARAKRFDKRTFEGNSPVETEPGKYNDMAPALQLANAIASSPVEFASDQVTKVFGQLKDEYEAARDPSLAPDLPTIEEQGMQDASLDFLFGPAGKGVGTLGKFADKTRVIDKGMMDFARKWHLPVPKGLDKYNAKKAAEGSKFKADGLFTGKRAYVNRQPSDPTYNSIAAHEIDHGGRVLEGKMLPLTVPNKANNNWMDYFSSPEEYTARVKEFDVAIKDMKDMYKGGTYSTKLWERMHFMKDKSREALVKGYFKQGSKEYKEAQRIVSTDLNEIFKKSPSTLDIMVSGAK